jgi:hypothetical protein
LVFPLEALFESRALAAMHLLSSTWRWWAFLTIALYLPSLQELLSVLCGVDDEGTSIASFPGVPPLWQHVTVQGAVLVGLAAALLPWYLLHLPMLVLLWTAQAYRTLGLQAPSQEEYAAAVDGRSGFCDMVPSVS